MHNIQRQGPFDETYWRKSVPVVEEYMDNAYYNYWIPPISLLDDAASTTTMFDINATPTREFPDALVNQTLFAIRKPRLWINGRVSARIHYTDDAGGPGNFMIGLGIVPTTRGSVLSALASQSLAIPAVGGFTYQYTDAFQALTGAANPQITYDDTLISVIFSRTGNHLSDTANVEFYLIGIELMYKEAEKTIGYRSERNREWTSKL